MYLAHEIFLIERIFVHKLQSFFISDKSFLTMLKTELKIILFE